MRHGKDYETYIIPRPQSNGNVILGGFMQKGIRYGLETSSYIQMLMRCYSTGDTFSSEVDSIVERTTNLLPDLLTHGICWFKAIA